MIGTARHALKRLTGCSPLSAAAWHTDPSFRNMGVSSDGLQEQKKALRKMMKSKLRQLSAEDMQRESE